MEKVTLLVSVNSEESKLERIKKYALQLVDFTKGINFEVYQADVQISYACTFSLLQMGNIGNRLTNETLSQLEIPWQAITAARGATNEGHSLSHKKIIWNEIESKLPNFLLTLEEVMSHAQTVTSA